METLYVSIEHNGKMLPVGEITGEDYRSAVFQYHNEYRKMGFAPISLSLPVQEEPFTPEQTRNYFEGLLPEGFTRRSVAQWLNRDENDYTAILHDLGKECLGAVCITEKDEEVKASYEPVSENKIRELAAEGAVKAAEFVTKSHLSLTGASGKVGLYYEPEKKTWFFPYGTAPSTHIVKQSHVRLREMVTNELLCLKTASLCGIEVPDSFIVNTGSGMEDEILFATKRYDRSFGKTAEKIDGLLKPYRLHQEDFAQALGVSAADKYEKKPQDYLRRMSDLLRIYSADPISDLLKLWDRILFDFLIGNTDAHLKNFSLLYSSDRRTVRFAPSYDVISTVIYAQSTHDMSICINGKHDLDELTEKDLLIASKEIGLGRNMAEVRMKSMIRHFTKALRQAVEELKKEGYLQAVEIGNQILQNGGIKTFKNI